MKNIPHLRLVLFCCGLLLAGAVTAQESKFDEPPMPLKTVAPAYPAELRRDGVSGMVTMGITVDEKGNVSNPVVKKSTRPEFEQPAIDAILKWKFKPATKGGTPISVQVVIPMKFSVN